MLSAKSFTPVSVNVSRLALQASCCVSDPARFLNASSFPVFVSHGDMDAHLVPSKNLCLGIAQSYLDRKLHITTTHSTSWLCATALNTLLAMPELPVPGYAAQMYSC